MNEATAKSYTLMSENNHWLGQVVLTSNNMFASVTDWGNFSFLWISVGDQTFEEFLIGLDVEYFANKMVQGFSYVLHNKKIDAAAKVFAKKILPALQKELKRALND